MKYFLSALALTISLLCATTSPSLAAPESGRAVVAATTPSAGEPHWVTRREYRKIKRNMRAIRVYEITDGWGKLMWRSNGYMQRMWRGWESDLRVFVIYRASDGMWLVNSKSVERVD